MIMNLQKKFFLALLVLSVASRAVSAETNGNKPDPGPFTVETIRYEWKDAKRNRDVPVKIYYPKTGTNFPLVIFSHGLGGSREAYEYLGRHWASHGYVCVHVQHIGSDDSVWRGAENLMKSMKASAANLTNALNRPLDVSFVIDQMSRLTNALLRAKLDLKKIGVAGHSFGAFTTLAVAGQTFLPQVRPTNFTDVRVTAAIAMSAPVSRDVGATYDKIKIPIFHMTGTLDESPIGNTSPKDRRVPFDCIANAEEFLVTFDGGDHMIFAGRGLGGDRTKDPRFQELIKMSSTAFWDAFLKCDATAKGWFSGGGFEKALATDGVFEMKSPAVK